MNYLQVKVVTNVLEEKIKYLKDCEYIKNFDKPYCKEDIERLEEFVREIQGVKLEK